MPQASNLNAPNKIDEHPDLKRSDVTYPEGGAREVREDVAIARHKRTKGVGKPMSNAELEEHRQKLADDELARAGGVEEDRAKDYAKVRKQRAASRSRADKHASGPPHQVASPPAYGADVEKALLPTPPAELPKPPGREDEKIVKKDPAAAEARKVQREEKKERES